MRNFTALDWCAIPGRGSLAVIGALPEGDDLYDPCLLQGQRVVIDGTECLVCGVDTFAIPRSPDRPYRHPFGLLVAEFANPIIAFAELVRDGVVTADDATTEALMQALEIHERQGP